MNPGVVRPEEGTEMKTMWLGGMLFLMATCGFSAPARAEDDEPDSSAIEASKASALSEIRERAESMPIDTRLDIDKRIDATVTRVDRDASTKSQAKIAGKLATKFDLTSDALLELKGEYGLSWGELVVAQTLLANSSVKVDLVDLASLRSDGLSWGAIAYGLRFHLEDLEEAIRLEGRVATGLSKAQTR
jgi:hypothetical protein